MGKNTLRTSAMAATQPQKTREAEEAKRKGKSLATMPTLVLLKVAERLEDYDRIAFASTCTAFRDAIWEVVKGERKEGEEDKKKLVTDLRCGESGRRWSRKLPLLERAPCFSLGWFKWVFGSFDRLEGAAPYRGYGDPKHKQELYDSDLMRLAAFQGSVETMKWLREQGIRLDFAYGAAGYHAAMGGHIEALEWLRSEGYEFNRMTCAQAAKGGQLETLEWVRSQDTPCPWDEWTCSNAAEAGHLDVLKWMRGQDPPCPWDKHTCSNAAEGGHLNLLEWIRSQDPPCPWDDDACYDAAYGGHLEILKWLRGQNPPCPWYKNTYDSAAHGGHLEILKWVHSQDPPFQWDKITTFYAAQNGHLETLKWLKREGCAFCKSSCRDLASDYPHVVQWIDEQPGSDYGNSDDD